MTEEQYLAMERIAPEKHQYLRGRMWTMPGGSYEHNLIAANIASLLHRQLEHTDCRVLSSDMRIYSPAAGLFTYADASVVCGKPEFRTGTRDNLLNPVLIVEVLSPSTRDYDEKEKFEHYRSIESFRYYVTVEQERPCILIQQRWPVSSVYSRMPGWKPELYFGIGATAHLPELPASLPLQMVYQGVEFNAA
jgi:Uma2 family endonuclease